MGGTEGKGGGKGLGVGEDEKISSDLFRSLTSEVL